MKLLVVVGARPQFIKLAALSKALRANPSTEEIILHTGQHYDDRMSDSFFRELGIPKPSLNLGVGSGPHGAQTGQMLAGIEEALQSVKPDWTLVFGDTNSTMAGALASVKLHIPVAHVELGLRSFNRQMPEEINRVVTDHVSELLFAPTETAMENLRHEGVPEAKLKLVGDVMYDAALHFGELAGQEALSNLGVAPKSYALATVHRAENTDDPARLTQIFEALEWLAAQLPVVLPLHPRTRGLLERAGQLRRFEDAIRFIEPVGYLEMVALEKNARLIATDSGGVQKEALFYRVPCVTLREETEWVELVELGWNRLVRFDQPKSLRNALRAGLDQPLDLPVPADLYGGGKAAEAITKALEERA